MDIKLFQQKLNDICAIAEENNKQLSQQQIRDHFDESDLRTSQLVKILQLSLIHISEPTRLMATSRMPSSA